MCWSCPALDTSADATGRAFSWFFEREGWFGKLALGGVCILFGCLLAPLLALLGYAHRIAVRAIRDPWAPPPEWDDLGGLIAGGFKAWLAMLLPAFAIMIPLVGAMFAFGMLGIDPNQRTPNDAFMITFVLIGMGLNLALSLLQPAILIEYLLTGSLLSGFQVGRLWRHIFDRFGDYLVLFIMGFVIQMLATIVGYMSCYILFFLSAPWALCSYAWLMGRYVGKHYPEVGEG